MHRQGSRPGKKQRGEEGVSVIVGTLLLILITVTAAAALAVMVSELQKEEMKRQSHQQQVKNEELRISHVDFTFDPADWSAHGVNSSTNWTRMNITVLNLNIEDSRLISISINEKYLAVMRSGEESVNVTGRQGLPVEATKSRELNVSLIDDFPVPLNISMEEPVRIRVMTSLYNTFEKTVKPPTPVARFHVESEDLGVAERDVLVLDGSDSFDDGSLLEWTWGITDGSRTFPSPGLWQDTANCSYSNLTGKIARLTPVSAGPLEVNLTVRDDSGMVRTSRAMDIPQNPRFIPPVKLNVSHDAVNQTLMVSVTGLSGAGVPGQVVSFVKQDVYPGSAGNLTLNKSAGLTDLFGITSAGYAGNGTAIIRVASGKLPPWDVPVTV